MLKKTIPIISSAIQKVEYNNNKEDMNLCKCCKTITNTIKDNLCLFCKKKIEQFLTIRVFTFKPCYYLFSKIGIENSLMKEIEDQQRLIGFSENYLEYCDQNMVWYIYKDISNNDLFVKIEEMFNVFKETYLFNKNIYKYNIDKVRSNFSNNKKYVSIGFCFTDVGSDDYKEAGFLMRDRIFS